MKCLKLVKVSDIKIGTRIRQDMGDITELAASIKLGGRGEHDKGMLQPIVLLPNNELFLGHRRFQAILLLGWDEVTVVIVNDVHSRLEALRGEIDENVCRKEFTLSEALAWSKRKEELLTEEAKERQVTGREKGLRVQGKLDGAESAPSTNIEKTASANGKTRIQAAEGTGYSHDTLKKADDVDAAAKEDPARYGDLLDIMNTKSVNAAHKVLLERQAQQSTKGQVMLDQAGVPVPDELRDLFGDPWVYELADQIGKWIDKLTDAKLVQQLKGKAPAYGAFLLTGEALKKLAGAVDLLEEFETIIQSGIPHVVCSKCKGLARPGINGIKCQDCRNAGWLPKWRADELDGKVPGGNS